MNKQVKNLLSVGDIVYSASNGREMTVISIDDQGFETSDDYFLFSEVRTLFYLTRFGYWHARCGKGKK